VREEFVEDLPHFFENAKKQHQQVQRPANPDHIDLQAAREQVQEIHDAGCKVIYFLPPMFDPHHNDLALAQEGIYPILLNFHDPLTDQELYKPEFWFDRLHLNVVGSKIFTRMVADRVAEVIRGGSL
jgi:hypothetical protein